MSDEHIETDVEGRVRHLEAEVATLRNALSGLAHQTEEGTDRADLSENHADAQRVRVDHLESRATAANHRADASDVRADAQDDRIDELEARVDVDREMIAELQAEGLLSKQTAAELEVALRSSRKIGAAMGIVMAHRNLNEEDAFALLARASQRANQKLRVLAEEVVHTGDLSSLIGA